MKPIAYVACPYTHPDPAVREYRARLSAWVSGNLVAKGEVVYCPITHGHMMAKECDLPTDWEFWMSNDSAFFALCDKMYVIKADGWEQSCGVQVEITMAANVNMPVEYIDPDAFGPWDGAAKEAQTERLVFSYFIECVHCGEMVDLFFADERSMEIFAETEENLRRDAIFVCEKCRGVSHDGDIEEKK